MHPTPPVLQRLLTVRHFGSGALGVALAWVVLTSLATQGAFGQYLVSGNENKIELTTGKPRWIRGAAPDSLSIIQFDHFPPTVRHTRGIENTVIGPPSNVAISKDGRRAILANSIRIVPEATPDPWEPHHEVHLLDLTADPIRVLSTVSLDAQPSGLSWHQEGGWCLVACRAAGSVCRVLVENDQLRKAESVEVAKPEEAVSDVAITRDGQRAIASVQKAGYLRLLEWKNDQWVATDQKASAYGQPYRVVITPDDSLALTAGQGSANNGVDLDALTVIDLKQTPIRSIAHIPIGSVPESIEISPNGLWVAAVMMNGSHYPANDPRHQDHGELVLLRRNGLSFEVKQRAPIGRVPEGVAFTPQGDYLLVQCHPDRLIWIFRVTDEGVEDTGYRIDVPGMPASLRSSG